MQNYPEDKNQPLEIISADIEKKQTDELRKKYVGNGMAIGMCAGVVIGMCFYMRFNLVAVIIGVLIGGIIGMRIGMAVFKRRKRG